MLDPNEKLSDLINMFMHYHVKIIVIIGSCAKWLVWVLGDWN